MNRRFLIGAVVIIALIAAVSWAYVEMNRPQLPSLPESLGELTTAEDTISSASSTLVPERYAALAFRAGGRVQKVAVADGQTVAAGDVLVQLADDELRAAVAQAEAGLAAAQADLARVKAGARPEQVAQAQAGVAAAQAGLGRLTTGARPEEIAQAQAVVAASEARLFKTRSGVRPEQVAVAEAQVQQAETALAVAQDAYDRLRWVGGETERNLIAQRDAAGAALATAKAQLAAAKAPAQAEDITASQAQVTQAQAVLDALKAGATKDEIAAAQAVLAQAQAQLALTKAGATAEEVAAAQARVDAAKAAADQARAMLAEAALRAPFAGTITSVNARAGEIAVPAQPVVIIADLSTLRLETDDLSETRVIGVRSGQAVSAVFEALPGRTFRGKVTHVAAMSSLKQGGTNYAVTIALDAVDPALRWGMTARVEIDTKGQ